MGVSPLTDSTESRGAECWSARTGTVGKLPGRCRCWDAWPREFQQPTITWEQIKNRPTGNPGQTERRDHSALGAF